jgi:hypothetical protein
MMADPTFRLERLRHLRQVCARRNREQPGAVIVSGACMARWLSRNSRSSATATTSTLVAASNSNRRRAGVMEYNPGAAVVA